MAKQLLVALAAGFALAGCRAAKVEPPAADPCNVDGQNPCTEPARTRCLPEGGAARCLCDVGFLPRPGGACEAQSADNCPVHAGDSAEPDDCLGRAQGVAPDGSERHQSIASSGDVDFFQFEATAGTVYRVSALPEGALSPRIDLFDPGGRVLSTVERTGATQLDFKARLDGLHYFRVSHSPLDPSLATGNYTLTFSTSGREDHGDGPNNATPLPSVTGIEPGVSGRFDFPGDQDWFRFSTIAEETYTVTLRNEAGGFAPARVELFLASRPGVPQWAATGEQGPHVFSVGAPDTAFVVVYAPETLGSYRIQLTRRAR